MILCFSRGRGEKPSSTNTNNYQCSEWNIKSLWLRKWTGRAIEYEHFLSLYKICRGTNPTLSNGSTYQTYHKTTYMQAKTNADNAKPDVVLRRF